MPTKITVGVVDKNGTPQIRLTLNDLSTIDLPDCNDALQTVKIGTEGLVLLANASDSTAVSYAVDQTIFATAQINSDTSSIDWIFDEGVTCVQDDSQTTIGPADNQIYYLEVTYQRSTRRPSTSGPSICKGCVRIVI